MDNVIVGLIKGRHEMPVSKYIFENAIEDVHDYDAIWKQISDFVETEIGITQTLGNGLDQADYTDVYVYSGCKKLVVYITGLTCVTAELIKYCAFNGISLTLMNFDSINGEYKAQSIFQGEMQKEEKKMNNAKKMEQFANLFSDFIGSTTHYVTNRRLQNPNFIDFYKWISNMDEAMQISFMMYIWANWLAFSVDIINRNYHYTNVAMMVRESYLCHIVEL